MQVEQLQLVLLMRFDEILLMAWVVYTSGLDNHSRWGHSHIRNFSVTTANYSVVHYIRPY